MTIIVAADNPEAAEFVAWLREQGHDASVGNSTGNYVDGSWTSANEGANETMQRMWEAYCDAH